MKPPTNSLAQPTVPIKPDLHRKAIALCNLDPSLDLEAKLRFYLNQIALEMTLDWFGHEIHPTALHHNWSQINGSLVLLTHSGKRAVIIPSDAIECAEMVVSDYWITSQHCSDYFLYVQINPNEQWLTFWGYTHCKALKEANQQQEDVFTIRLEELIKDIAVFSVVNQVCPHEATQ